MKRFVYGATPGRLFRFALVVRAVLGQGEQDHGELLFADLAVAVEVAAAQNRLLEVEQVLRVVVLRRLQTDRISLNGRTRFAPRRNASARRAPFPSSFIDRSRCIFHVGSAAACVPSPAQ